MLAIMDVTYQTISIFKLNNHCSIIAILQWNATLASQWNATSKLFLASNAIELATYSRGAASALHHNGCPQ